MRVLRVYHAGRDAAHRARERALVAAGAEVTLVVPRNWPDPGSQQQLTDEPFDIIELDVVRAGDVNRHRYIDPGYLSSVVRRVAPDVVDLHEEPVSVAARQWLRAAADRPVVMYTAQNIDKRFPPPFAQYETAALRRVQALYPCSRQAASVARGKGFRGLVEVLPLGLDRRVFTPGDQDADAEAVVLGLVGRMVPEKGVSDAIRVLAAVRSRRPARLRLLGTGPALPGAMELADRLGVRDDVILEPWCGVADLATAYMGMHVVLVPSRATATWVEQFGRVVLEAQACGAVVAGYASGTIPEVSGDAAVLVPEGNVAGLAAAVTNLLDGSGEFTLLRELGLLNAAGVSWPDVARRQFELYQRVAHGPFEAADAAEPRISLDVSIPETRRARATHEFGSPAAVLGQTRPFALPYLRKPNGVSRTLARMLDVVTH